MPQLMPIYWGLSIYIMFIILLVMISIFGNSFGEADECLFYMGGSSFFWCW